MRRLLWIAMSDEKEERELVLASWLGNAVLIAHAGNKGDSQGDKTTIPIHSTYFFQIGVLILIHGLP